MSAAISGNHLLRDNVSMARPMWQGPPLMTRPPNPGAGPIVVSATGLGAGGGVGAAGGNSDSAVGHFRVFVGLAPAASGSIVVQWPLTPPVAPVFAASWATLVVTGTNPYTVAWTAAESMLANTRPIGLDYLVATR